MVWHLCVGTQCGVREASRPSGTWRVQNRLFALGLGGFEARLPPPLTLTLRVFGREVTAALSRWATGRWIFRTLARRSRRVAGAELGRLGPPSVPRSSHRRSERCGIVLHGVRLSRGGRRDQCRRDAVRRVFEALWTAFLGRRWQIDDLIAKDEFVVCRVTVSGTFGVRPHRPPDPLPNGCPRLLRS